MRRLPAKLRKRPASGGAFLGEQSAQSVLPILGRVRAQAADLDGKSRERLMAEVSLSSVAANANVARRFAQGTFGEFGIVEAVAVMSKRTAKVQAGNLSEMEEMFVAEATALDSIFTELARIAALNMREYHLSATDTYLRLAFKAQSHARATVETLAEIKNPRPVAFVKQANIANGPQQVNNGTPAGEPHAHGKIVNQSNELLPTKVAQDTCPSYTVRKE